MHADVRIRTLTPSLSPPPKPPIGVALRPVSATDLRDLAVLYRDSYPPHIGAADPDEATQEIALTLTGAYGDLRLDASLLAAVRGEPAGAILIASRSIWDHDLVGPFIIDLFVTPRLRRSGVGSALLTGAIDACTRAGDRAISLRVGEGTSPAAHSLYAELGFTPAETAS